MMHVMQLGGPVLWVVGAVCAIIVFLIGMNLLHLHRASLRGGDFLSGIFNNLQRGNDMEAVALCDETPGPVSEMARVAILERRQGAPRIRQVMEEVGAIEIARLERGLPLLLALAQLAPMLGLLGTAVGMWQMVDTLYQQAPLVHAGDLGGGLRMALLTTIGGLSAGLIGYFGHACLVTRVGQVVTEMERAYLQIAHFLTQLPEPREGA